MMPDPAAVPVTVQGVTWTTFFTGGSFLALLGLLIRQVGPWRKQTTEASDKLIAQLTEQLANAVKRIDKVEKQLATERKMNFIQTARLEARHAAQRALDRHKFNNADGNLDALLRILEVSPEKAPEAARQAREARAQQRSDEALEAAQIHRAEMLAVEMAERELAEREGEDE